MSKQPSRNRIKSLLALMAVMIAAGALINDYSSAARASQRDLPESKGVEIVREKCLSCHEADVIVAQRLSKAGWGREVDKMIRWGAIVGEAEKEPIIAYLSANFGPAPAVTPSGTKDAGAANDDRGKATFENKCLSCHEIDLVEQQRLSRPGWTREVEKMIRWGAAVTEEEKESLIDHLFKNYGPRRK